MLPVTPLDILSLAALWHSDRELALKLAAESAAKAGKK